MKKILLLLAAVTLMAVFAACSAEAETPAATAGTESQKQYVEAYGNVKATEVKNINLDFQAPITSIDVKEGQKVKSGQKLASLDLSDLNNQLTVKGLELKASENELSRTHSGTDLRKLQNDLKSARDIYNKSLSELAKKEDLYKSGSLSLSELDSFKKSVESNKKAVDDAQFAIGSLVSSKGTDNTKINLDASILESNLSLLKSKLDKTYISGNDVVSDVNNGIVYDIGYVKGDIAGPEKKLMSILDLDSLIVEANVPEEFIKDVKTGAEVIIIPTADKTKEYKGKVTQISGRAVRSNGETLVAVLISIDNIDEFLLPEFNVDIKIQMN